MTSSTYGESFCVVYSLDDPPVATACSLLALLMPKSCLPKRVRENVKMFLARVHAMLWARDVFGSRHSFDFDVKIWGTRSRACRKRDTADWTRFCFERCSDLLFEAMRIGIYNDNYSIVYTCLLQTAEPRNWRKVGRGIYSGRSLVFIFEGEICCIVAIVLFPLLTW